jgi:hypothetical protein
MVLPTDGLTHHRQPLQRCRSLISARRKQSPSIRELNAQSKRRIGVDLVELRTGSRFGRRGWRLAVRRAGVFVSCEVCKTRRDLASFLIDERRHGLAWWFNLSNARSSSGLSDFELRGAPRWRPLPTAQPASRHVPRPVAMTGNCYWTATPGIGRSRYLDFGSTRHDTPTAAVRLSSVSERRA